MKCTLSFVFILVSFIANCQADTSFKAFAQNIPGSAITFKMAPIPAGSFIMGSAANEPGRLKDEGPQLKIQIDAFWMCTTETTYDMYDAFFQDENTSRNTDADAITRPSPPYIDFTLGMGKQGGFPANSMQQYGAIMFCRWLYNKTGVFFRLPTEAEWEYACRAGSSTAYFFGSDSSMLKDYAWYAGNSGNVYHKVAELKPNAWGLYDMLGNAGEWTLDQYEENYFDIIKDKTNNPVIAPAKRHPRTVKGGNYSDAATTMRCASRLPTNPVWNRRDPQIPKSKWWNADAPFIGFRIIKPLKQPTKEEAEAFFKLYLGK